MSPHRIPPWLAWAREIQALAQSGLTFTRDPFDVERYERLRAIAADILAQYGDVPADVCTTLFTSQAGYATPKMDVRGVVFQDGKLLLVRERSDGLWTLPGGWADVGQSPSDAVVKEVREESGYEVRAERILMLLDRDRHDHPPIAFHTWKLFILCTITGGAAVGASAETDGVAFFAEDDLPPLSVGRVTSAQIARLFEHHRTPGMAADFDQRRDDLETGEERRLSDLPPDVDVRDFDISRDGREVVLEQVREDSDVVLIELPSR